jgi:inositol transport system ATP-binding protein
MPLLQATDISKRFLGVAALQEVSFTVNSGEVHALLGENGAGKSTLLKILAGAHPQDSGVLEFEGQPLGLQTPAERQREGIVTVYQEFNLMPNMSVGENVFIGRERGPGYFVDWKAMRRKAIAAVSRLYLQSTASIPEKIRVLKNFRFLRSRKCYLITLTPRTHETIKNHCLLCN